MKLIILSAFQQRLKSEVIEWPDWPDAIRIPMSHWIHGFYELGKDTDISIGPIQHVGIFRNTEKYEVYKGKHVLIYELCEIL